MAATVGASSPGAGCLRSLRDDGWLSAALGRLAGGAFSPLLPALTGAAVAVVLLAVGIGQLGGISLFAPVAALLLAGVGAGHPHDGRWDWAAPLLLRGTEYLYVFAVGLSAEVAQPLLFVLVAALAARDWTRGRPCSGGFPGGRGQAQDWTARAMLGWDGRMLVLALGAVLGLLPFAFGLLAGYVWVLNGWSLTSRWLATEVVDHRRGA